MAKLGDDATVYRVSDELAVVQTIDIITPVVDDPYAFGQVAAANALSDIYAMGATPTFALNVVGFPVRSLPIDYLEQILLGGAAKAAEAGVPVAGGHSIEDYAPKYGLSVTGFVHPGSLITKGGGRPGDALFLTKPLGIGIITTALDQGLADNRMAERILPVMTTLNRAASEAMVKVGATACTDVTGFGFLGHLHELARASGVSARVQAGAIPVLPEARTLAGPRTTSTGTRNNLQFLSPLVEWGAGTDDVDRLILADAQTSGGLLIAVPQARKAEMQQALQQAGCLSCEVGSLVAGEPGRLIVER